ncbi:Hypothetical_protein [Hexamita inflata]|uniref:Hypothetical_protein n=1 Tax=Hexamita inflata TaxID=28002 RepID=A0AA86NTF1_9EUKA|nr:Hypothetical protein HINF_LOCUS13375 [Hexamita inflata]
MQLKTFTRAAAKLLNITCDNNSIMQQYIIKYIEMSPEEYFWFELSFILNKPAQFVKQFYENVYLMEFKRQNGYLQSLKHSEVPLKYIENVTLTKQLQQHIQQLHDKITE